MNLSAIANVIQELRGRMPESLRTLVASRMLTAYFKDIPYTQRTKEKDDEVRDTFNKLCGLTSSLPYVSHDIQLSDSDLAKFCNRWMAVEQFRKDGEWRPITADMNDLRHTMCKELEELAKGPEAQYRGKHDDLC